MKIAIYNTKGSAGKTPIATNIALDKGFCIGTNEPFHVYNDLIPENRLIALRAEDSFPQSLVTHDIDIVFDLAGSISKHALSITSALNMSDYVLVPIYNELKCLVAGINTINQVLAYNKNIIVIATKLTKQKGEELKGDYKNSSDYKNILNLLNSKFSLNIPVLPLKYSKVFDNIFEERKSIKQIMSNNPLAGYSYKEVSEQFELIYNIIGI